MILMYVIMFWEMAKHRKIQQNGLVFIEIINIAFLELWNTVLVRIQTKIRLNFDWPYPVQYFRQFIPL